MSEIHQWRVKLSHNHPWMEWSEGPFVRDPWPTDERDGFKIERRTLYTAPPSPERMREALEELISDKKEQVRTHVWVPPSSAWHRAFGYIAALNEALEALRAGDNHASDGKECSRCDGTGNVLDDPDAPPTAACPYCSDPTPPDREAIAMAMCCPDGCIRESEGDCWAMTNKEMSPFRENQIKAILALCAPDRKLPSDDLGAPLERIRTEAARLGYALVPSDPEKIARIIHPVGFEEDSMERISVVAAYRKEALAKADRILALRGGE